MKSHYQANRRAARAAADTREDRGLPQHPAASGLATCQACDGRGEHHCNNSRNGDPQAAYEIQCGECFGTGQVSDGRGPDLLTVLASVRRYRKREGFRYASARRDAMRRSLDCLAQMEGAIRVAGMYRDMVAAEMRAAA